MSENGTETVSVANAGSPAAFARASEKATRASEDSQEALSLDSVMGIPVTVQVVLGTTTLQVSQLMKLSRGAILPLDNRVGEPVDVVVNGRVVARGELVLMDEDSTRFGVSLTEIIGSRPMGTAS
jgi:flagellar motor switch protein FliN/FliY